VFRYVFLHCARTHKGRAAGGDDHSESGVRRSRRWRARWVSRSKKMHGGVSKSFGAAGCVHACARKRIRRDDDDDVERRREKVVSDEERLRSSVV
jgi:hypothetical protein